MHLRYIKLETSEKNEALKALNASLDTTQFTEPYTEILAKDLPFYPGYQALEVTSAHQTPVIRRHALYNTQTKDIHILNGRNDEIYKLNQSLPAILTSETIVPYVQFFFSAVRGKHGKFILTHSTDDFQWSEMPSPATLTAISNMLSPLRITEIGDNGDYTLVTTILFKESLFKSRITVDKDGIVSLDNEELLLEAIPLLDNVFGQ